MRCRRWTETEDRLIRLSYGRAPTRRIAKALGRSMCAVQNRASLIGAAGLRKQAPSERERQILDMWPKFEDGEYVLLGDAYIDTDGDANKVRGINFEEGLTDLMGIESFYTGFWAGERVKRPAPKDSWERLEEDAAKEPCDYFGVECDEDKGCSGCPHLHEGRDCTVDLQADIVRRAKALAGVEVD